jgi:hypothetical protein
VRRVQTGIRGQRPALLRAYHNRRAQMAVMVVCRGVGGKGGSQILEEVSIRQWWYMRLNVRAEAEAEAEGGGSAEWLETWSRQPRSR